MDPRENGSDHHTIFPSHYHQYAQPPVYSTWRYDQDHIYGDLVSTALLYMYPFPSCYVTSLLRGPLMQRALVIETREIPIPGTIDLEISPYSDIMSSDFPIPKEIPTTDLRVPGRDSGYQEALRGFQVKTPIHLRGAESCSNCSLAVTAFRFDYSDCITSTATVDLDTLLTEKRRNCWVDAFHIDITKGVIGDLDHYKRGEGILVNVTRKITPECNGAKLVNGGNATFVSDSWTGDSIVKPVKHSDPGQLPKIEFLSQSTSQLWDAQISMAMGSIRITPESPREYLVMSDPLRKGLASFIYYNQEPGNYDLCSATFDDPMDDIFKSFRELVLRLAIVDAVEWNAFAVLTNSATNQTTLPLAQQTVPYQSNQVRVLYAAQIPALVLASVISLLGPLATIFLFWGWWNLGKDFSMNPLELVKALLVRGTGMGTENGAGMGMTTNSAPDAVNGQRQGHQNYQDCDSQQHNASRAQVIDHVRRRIRGTRDGEVGKEKDGDGKGNDIANMIEVEAGSSSDNNRSSGGSRKGRSRMREPTIQHGVLDSTGRLGFAVSGAEGVIRARCPRRGEMPHARWTNLISEVVTGQDLLTIQPIRNDLREQKTSGSIVAEWNNEGTASTAIDMPIR
ncbi:hypothetical protein B0T13DRAFT_526109 [Neurospora crassa]|nr:hypothetical protein B0T13DRAFT_526109 [Neurospora crassa]